MALRNSFVKKNRVVSILSNEGMYPVPATVNAIADLTGWKTTATVVEE